MTAETAGPARCPKCGAAVRPGDPWCTLCYADLRPAATSPEPPEEDVTASPDPPLLPAPSYAASVVVGPDPLTGPLESTAEPSWPCGTCGATNPIDRETCSACGMPFLSTLRGQEAPLLELPVVGDVSRLSRGQRLLLAGGVVVAFVLLTFLIGLIFR